MNFRVIFNSLGKVAVVLGVLMLLPMIVAIGFSESSWWTFAVTIALTELFGLPLMFFCKPKTRNFYSREGFILVSLCWLYASIVSTLPYIISRQIPSFVDALFEMVSGFTTTGATILSGERIEALPKGLQFWRCFTHWIGGMGIIVFVMALISGQSERSMHVLRAEMPGPIVDKIVPRARDTAKILYLIYISFTIIQICLLILSGMPVYDSIVNSFSTAGTGGFSPRADSIAGYNSTCQWIIAIFMVLYGVNFNVYYLMLLRRFKSAISSQEFLTYLGIVAFSSLTIFANILNKFSYTMEVGDALRHAFAQVASFMTTTGNSTIPVSSSINDWPNYSKTVLFLLMFIGGCAGSTAGGLKVSRVVMLFSALRKALRKALHPRNANVVRYEGKPLSDEAVTGVTNYFWIYMVIMAVVLLILSLDSNSGLTIETNITATVSCFNNVGPAYGIATSGYYMYSWLSKLTLTIAMLLGRLEIYPLILSFAPSTWIKK